MDNLPEADAFQARFERDFGGLTRPHVRALAWLLAAPDLLDPAAPRWGGRIATLARLDGPHQRAADAAWLAALDADPAPLEAALGGRFYSRLGLYAEKLMAFYFAQRGLLQAHGLQVRAARNDTVGEFDYLLYSGAALLHWEFATKFYLLSGVPDASLNCLVGPNLADTLGLKMRKILERQLMLSGHAAAQPLLPRPVDEARALVKGWLFYPLGAARVPIDGIAPDHNHGFWSTLEQLEQLPGLAFALIPRLLWLAPARLPAATEVWDWSALQLVLAERFALDPSPVMVAAVHGEGGWLLERRRGFIVPDDWPLQLEARRADGRLPV